jgi:hypothetical protein
MDLETVFMQANFPMGFLLLFGFAAASAALILFWLLTSRV